VQLGNLLKMNRIKVIENEIVELKIPKKISFSLKPSENEFDIASLEICCSKDCDLELDLTSNAKKIRIKILVEKNVTFNLYLYQRLENSKVQYNYDVLENGILHVFKFQKVPVGKEMMAVHLLGENAQFDYQLKDMCIGKETLDYYVYHDEKNTSSNIKNNIFSIKGGKSTIQVSTFVPKGKKGCVANQSNRIISLNEKKNEIRPNLYIDEYDVIANHSALIGKFSSEEMFYLQSRGISKMEATKLLLNGFLLSDISNKRMQKEIIHAIKDEWR